MNTPSITTTLDFPPPRWPRYHARRKPMPLDPGVRMKPFYLRKPGAALVAALPAWARKTLAFTRDLFFASLVTLVFLSPVLAFAAAPFTWEWTTGVVILTTAVMLAGRWRARAVTNWK